MNHLPDLIKDLALILAVAGIVALIFKRLKQPLVLGYIVAGFLATEGKKVGRFEVFLRTRSWFWIAMTTMEAIAHL